MIRTSGIERDANYWQQAEHELRSQFKSEVTPCIKDGDKLAVFGIAPIPLLVLFGHLLSDFNVTNIQNLFRGKDNEWAWPDTEVNLNDNSIGNFVVHLSDNVVETYDKKILILSLTSAIRDRIDVSNAAVWEITPSSGPGKKPHNKLILCGLVFFRLLLAGLCPTRQVEVEGIEPSSKRGINKLSTCLVCELVFVHGQAHDSQPMP